MNKRRVRKLAHDRVCRAISGALEQPAYLMEGFTDEEALSIENEMWDIWRYHAERGDFERQDLANARILTAIFTPPADADTDGGEA